MTLYEINSELQACVDGLTDPDTGEVNEEVLARMGELQMERDEKIEAIACAIKNLNADAAALKTEADALNARMKSARNKADRLQAYLQDMLNGEKFKSARVSIGQRTAKAVAVADETALIDWLTVNGGEEALRVKPVELRRDVLRRWMDDGRELPGCSIEERHSITIR